MRKSTVTLLIAATLGLPLTAEATPLSITNGNFATPSGGVFTTYSGGSTAITGWTVTGNSVDLVGSYWQAPPGGGQSVDLDGGAPGGLTQTLTTTPGHTYTVSFDLSGNPDGGPSTKSLTVSAGAAATTYFYAIGSNSHADMMYALELFTFTATGASTALSFTSNDVNSPYGPVIGDVAAVPEPAAIAMLAVGLLGLGFARRRGA